MFSPDIPLAELDWVPRPRIAPLTRLGLITLADLIAHYPRRHEDRRRFDRFPDEEMDRPVCLFGLVTKTAAKRFGGWKRMFEATIVDESGGILGQPITLRWFNLPYIQKMLAQGHRVVVFGRPKKKGRQIVIDHPEFEIVEEDISEVSIHLNRITPVHPAGDGISPRVMRALIDQALQLTDLESMPHLLPPSVAQASRIIHFPETFEQWETARQQLVREEFFSIQLLIGYRRSQWLQLTGQAKPASGKLWDKVLKSLPFDLTDSQKTVIAEVRHDLASKHRMNRLLQGDVGSGKTLVALAALLLTIEAGYQAAIMAPTQILAEQHYLNFHRLLAPLGINVLLRTGSKRDSDAASLFAGKLPSIVVGTHALLYEGSEFQNLGLVVIDEQHKFGVLQRAKLIARGDAPDVLVMTATPIPRTLTQTLYGDLDVSILREKPAHRGAIQTAVRDFEKLPEVAKFLHSQLEKGRQGYIVYPLVEESDKLTAKSAKTEFEKWKPLLAPFSLGLLHGRMKPEEKEAVMRDFRDGTLSALVSTTVIEVGVDVPNANIMVVENAERFGLAQLHQLRGRIGRGEHKSFCILLHDPKAEELARKKLSVLEQTSDGFDIAEADLELRGPGDLLGTAQTGLPPLKLGNLFRDVDLMQESRREVDAVLAEDPLLQKSTHQALRKYIERAGRKLETVAG